MYPSGWRVRIRNPLGAARRAGVQIPPSPPKIPIPLWGIGIFNVNFDPDRGWKCKSNPSIFISNLHVPFGVLGMKCIFEKNIKKQCFGYWQKVRHMIIYRSCRESGAKERESKRNLKRNEKSSWQIENDVLVYRSSLRAKACENFTLYLVNWITWRRTKNTLDNYELFKFRVKIEFKPTKILE